MTDEEDDIVLIDLYLTGEATADQKELAEQRLKDDAEFLTLYNQVKIGVDTIRINTRKKLKEQISQLEITSEKEIASRRNIMRFWPAAIAALLIISFGVFWQLQNSRPKVPTLFAKVFVPYPNVVMPTVRGSTRDSSQLALAYRAYDMGDYKKSIFIFEKIEPKDAGVMLYLGNSYLAAGEAKKARQQFQLLDETFDTFDDQAEWFLALTYLQENNVTECKSRLTEIIRKQNPYSSKALDLLTKIQSPTAR